ncbi:hypothetical protein MHU86_22742 [Fragilaria crotonensis]|nr:hypothetical protein MHU86_22742 [Fragilaria crotonensis]
MPFKEFDYGTTGYAAAMIDDNENDKNEMCFNAQQLDQLPITTTLFPGIDNTASPAVVHALMERIRANERHAVMVLQHDVEHRCIVELLKILEDAQCPDYMLHKVLMWAASAKGRSKSSQQCRLRLAR